MSARFAPTQNVTAEIWQPCVLHSPSEHNRRMKTSQKVMLVQEFWVTLNTAMNFSFIYFAKWKFLPFFSKTTLPCIFSDYPLGWCLLSSYFTLHFKHINHYSGHILM